MPRGGRVSKNRKSRPRPTWLWANKQKRNADENTDVPAEAADEILEERSAEKPTTPEVESPSESVVRRGTEDVADSDDDSSDGESKMQIVRSSAPNDDGEHEIRRASPSSDQAFNPLIDDVAEKKAPVIPITCHVLDTAIGQPASGLRVTLFMKNPNGDGWLLINKGTTNSDGRLPGLTTPGSISPGVHMMRFETEEYFSARKSGTFYPYVEIAVSADRHRRYVKVVYWEVGISEIEKVMKTGNIPEIYRRNLFPTKYCACPLPESDYPVLIWWEGPPKIVFKIENNEHYHVPLLLSPYGYSTYRGS